MKPCGIGWNVLSNILENIQLHAGIKLRLNQLEFPGIKRSVLTCLKSTMVLNLHLRLIHNQFSTIEIQLSLNRTLKLSTHFSCQL